jgi:tungstate transport system ATP-binding protein
MTVGQNVGLGLRFRGVPKREREERVHAWLGRMSISHLRDRPASKLSGGEAQRTSLARAMTLSPQVLFLDEPFASLDAPTRQNLLQEFRDVLAESGVTALFATHDRGEALALGHRIAVLVDGGVVQVDSPEEVFARPQNVEVARFVGVETLIPGRVKGVTDGLTEVDCEEIQLRAEAAPGGPAGWSPGEEVHVGVRPEAIRLVPGDRPPEPGQPNALEGRITRIFPGEAHVRVEVDCGPLVVALVSRATFRESILEVGQSVRATFPAPAVHLMGKAGN